jgi:integrase
MKQQSAFAIRRFKNQSGLVSWRIEGRLHGLRIRKNFLNREEAAAEKTAMELKALHVAAGMRSAPTFLTEAQLREAEDAYRRLEGRASPLLAYLDYALANYREHDQLKPLDEAVAEYYATKRTACERTLLSFRQLRSIENELAALKGYFPKAQVSEFTPAKLVPFLERGTPSLKTYNNRRGLLSTFFKFAFQKDWAAKNPVEKTPHHRINHRRGSAVTISVEKAAELMAFVETFEGGEMVPYFALCLFAGIRPCIRFGEIMKLQPESVRLDTGTIHIEPEVSKVRMKRLVAIQPNLATWLRAYPLDKFPIIPPNAVKMHRRICKRFKLTHDVMRHTFISMFVAKYRSMGEAALQAGNSESIIRKHYLDLKSKDEAERFFGIHPTSKNEASVLPFELAI